MCFSEQELWEAWLEIRNLRKLGSDGISLGAVRLVSNVRPDIVCSVLSCLASSVNELRNEQVLGRVYGKESGMPIPSECTAILPLSPLLSLIDVMLSTRVLSWVRSNTIPGQGCFIGGLPGTQCLDIGHSIQLIIEKSLDQKVRVAWRLQTFAGIMTLSI